MEQLISVLAALVQTIAKHEITDAKAIAICDLLQGHAEFVPFDRRGLVGLTAVVVAYAAHDAIVTLIARGTTPKERWANDAGQACLRTSISPKDRLVGRTWTDGNTARSQGVSVFPRGVSMKRWPFTRVSKALGSTRAAVHSRPQSIIVQPSARHRRVLYCVVDRDSKANDRIHGIEKDR